MKRRPKIGTRVRIVAGKYAGRQAETDNSTGCGDGNVAVWLLGGPIKIGVSVPLHCIDRDKGPIETLRPRPICVGDRLLSLTGNTWPLGLGFTVKRLNHDRTYSVEGDYSAIYGWSTLKPSAGFSERWCHNDGTPVAVP